ncbi:FCS-Like Zinc finger 17-like [Mangifera indica]|uniref:FCS-Like Zinc finger 17-like n=1 Tax=Mangifera indica TaxID=29780 RepID=UPI001CFA69F3|nr:FCS-Like Zinc finger 17-like [Mangifera indica]
MLPSFRNPFKVEEDIKGSSNESSVIVGLKILVHISYGKSNIVVNKPALPPVCKPTAEYSCFLKSCHLCNKKLSFHKDVYMRSDQGFCSIECRNRQIYLDDMKDLENSTKQMFSSARHHCSGDDRRETQLLLKELRKRRHNNQLQSHKIRWTLVS